MKLTDAGQNASANAVTRLLDGGTLRFLDAAGETLAELRYGFPAFSPADGGVAKANPIAREQQAPRRGEAASFEARAADGTVVFTGTVGTRNADINLNATLITEGAAVSLSGQMYIQPGGT